MNFLSNAIVYHFESELVRFKFFSGLSLYNIYYSARFHLPLIISYVYNSDSMSSSFLGKFIYLWSEYRYEIEDLKFGITTAFALHNFILYGYHQRIYRMMRAIYHSYYPINLAYHLLARLFLWSVEKYCEVQMNSINITVGLTLLDVYFEVKVLVKLVVKYISNSNIISFQRFRVSYLCDYSNFISSWDTFITCLGIFF